MSKNTISLNVDINPTAEADAADMECLTQNLRYELLELDIDSAEIPVSENVPDNAKVVDSFAWGELVLQLAASGGVLTTLIVSIQSWLTRGNECGITLEIDGDKLEVKGLSEKGQEKLISNWIERHSKGVG